MVSSPRGASGHSVSGGADLPRSYAQAKLGVETTVPDEIELIEPAIDELTSLRDRQLASMNIEPSQVSFALATGSVLDLERCVVCPWL